VPPEVHQDYVRSIQKTSPFTVLCGTAEGEIFWDANCPEENIGLAVGVTRNVSDTKKLPEVLT
jgi:hypothetical protein